MRACFAFGAALGACLAFAPSLSAQPAEPPPAAAQPAPTPQPAPPAPAGAQQQPPPPGYGYPPPPPGYGYPPPQYGYGYPPPPGPQAKEAPRELPYEEGQPTPPGYRYVERPRTGLIIAGSLVLGIPYALGLYAAAAADFENGSGWLAVPAVGPFLMIAARDDECDDSNSAGDSLECVGEIYLVSLLILDGMAQTAGAIMLGFGLSSNKKRWVRQDVSFTVGPTRVGQSGYGLGMLGRF